MIVERVHRIAAIRKDLRCRFLLEQLPTEGKISFCMKKLGEQKPGEP